MVDVGNDLPIHVKWFGNSSRNVSALMTRLPRR
jgi:hypothetical protein